MSNDMCLAGVHARARLDRDNVRMSHGQRPCLSLREIEAHDFGDDILEAVMTSPFLRHWVSWRSAKHVV